MKKFIALFYYNASDDFEEWIKKMDLESVILQYLSFNYFGNIDIILVHRGVRSIGVFVRSGQQFKDYHDRCKKLVLVELPGVVPRLQKIEGK
jgi:hypothetical protein